jgi:diapolycopene oxygenase
MNNVIVVGAGLGGLATAIRLAVRGFPVTILEKNSHAGGKMDIVCDGGYTFDTGPSLLTMPFVLEELFHDASRDIADYLELVRIDPICRYHFADGSSLDALSDPEQMAREVGRLSPSDVDGFRAFIAHGEQIYRAAAEPFLFQPFGSWTWRSVISQLRYLPAVTKLDSGRTLDQSVSRYVQDAKLRQLLNRFATYNGSSPYHAPATLAIIPYVEFTMGGWYVRGGMYSIARALVRLARELGVVIETGVEVERLICHEGSVAGVQIKNGETRTAGFVVVNADALYARHHLVGPAMNGRRRFLRDPEASLAGFVLLLGVNRRYPDLHHHTIYFSSDYRREFETLITDRKPYEDPTIYVSVSGISDSGLAPEGSSNMFILVNAPPLGKEFDWATQARSYRDLIIQRLTERGLTDLERHIEVEHMITPEDFHHRYNAHRGAIYGTSSNSRFSAFLRPPNRSRDVRQLYFVGGSSHPGGGIPLVLLSGKIVANMITEDMGETAVHV